MGTQLLKKRKTVFILAHLKFNPIFTFLDNKFNVSLIEINQLMMFGWINYVKNFLNIQNYIAFFYRLDYLLFYLIIFVNNLLIMMGDDIFEIFGNLKNNKEIRLQLEPI